MGVFSCKERRKRGEEGGVGVGYLYVTGRLGDNDHVRNFTKIMEGEIS